MPSIGGHVGSGLQALTPEFDWRVFAPKLDDSGRAYGELVRAIETSNAACENLQRISRHAAESGHGLDAFRTRAAALVLHDLIAMGWSARVARHYIEVRPPSGFGDDSKEAIRRQLEFGRNDQLREPATRRFIMGLERPGRASGLRPVTDLIADGRRLYDQLAQPSSMPREQRADLLASICQPYLQLVDAETRDSHTGLRLMDIWRYFRHSWATRYRSSPGRNLFYLIRDAAQPSHPVMAITALGNAVMQLTPRDKFLGWTLDGLRDLIAKGTMTDQEVIEAFRRRLEEDYRQIYADDLPIPISPSDSVSPEVLDRLRIIEEQSSGLRTQHLRDSDAESNPRRVERPTADDLGALARLPLFRAKRARAAREVLRALLSLRGARTVDDLLASEEGTWALQQALRQFKKQFSATAMMEITVCGGIPPYTHLLAGKLACLMMLSPRVAQDYASRYANDASIIASQMAGRPIFKQPMLVYLGTSSLYANNSSQYNRVRIPSDTLPGQRAELSYRDLGPSRGYGSPNLSAETEEALERLSDCMRTYRNVNFVFGEGQSPKMRRLREGFGALGLQRANILHHASSRIIYGAPLATNCARFLLGIDNTPTYALPDAARADDTIAGYWRTRWLASRLDHAPALAVLAKASPLSTRVSRLMPPAPHGPQIDLFDTHLSPKERSMPQPAKDDEKISFLRNLYRNESAYSDDVRLSRLRELNVKTPLDEVIRKVVRARGSVVITGNAGDGKTHTIRLLETTLKDSNAKVIVDASEFTHSEILAAWLEARAEDRPFCIAINEGPLVDLIRAHKTIHPWLDDLQRDLLDVVRYIPVEQDYEETFRPEPGKTVVIDLSLRRTLSPDLLERVLTKLTDDSWYVGCASCPGLAKCPVTALLQRGVWNREGFPWQGEHDSSCGWHIAFTVVPPAARSRATASPIGVITTARSSRGGRSRSGSTRR